MTPRQVLTLHGWGAEYGSMKPLAAFLSKNGYKAIPIHLGSYLSLFDDVKIQDIAQRMEQVIEEMLTTGSLKTPFHLIAHSTGALVAREWMAQRHEEKKEHLVDNFLMLAPANHGSPFATMGRSAIGRIFKFDNLRRGFQSGEEILHALEHGALYQEELDLRDRLSKNSNDTDGPFKEDKTRPFTIVGAQPMDYTSMFDQGEWDGTVRVAAANFDPHGMSVDFTEDILNPKITRWVQRGISKSPFAVLPDRSHLNILEPENFDTSPDHQLSGQLGRLILQALSVTASTQYKTAIKEWCDISEKTKRLAQNTIEGKALRKKILKKGDRISERYNQHYQIVTSVTDNIGDPVSDYYLWLTTPTQSQKAKGLRFENPISGAEIRAHKDVLKEIHHNRRTPNRSVLHLDRMELMKNGGYFANLGGKLDHYLMAGISVAAPHGKISFFHKEAKYGSGYIPLRHEKPDDYANENRFLKRNSTHYIEIIIPRIPDDDVFNLKPYQH